MPGATNYRIYRNTSPTFDDYYDAIAETTTPSFEDAGLGGNTTYYYAVCSFNAARSARRSR